MIDIPVQYAFLVTAGVITLATAIAWTRYNRARNGGVSSFVRHRQPTLTDQNYKHGGDLVARALAKHGVKFVFTLIGGHISSVIVGAQELGIRVIDVRHEVNAVFAADAVSRLSGVPGVACVTAGPGLTNTITAVKNAMMAQSPLILIGGATAGLLKGRGSLQDVDQQSLFAPHVKWQASITRVEDIIPTFDKAFCIAQSGTPGPVFIELPIDVIYFENVIRDEIKAKLPKDNSLISRIMRLYVNSYYLKRLYGGRGGMKGSEPYDVETPESSESQLNKCLKMLQNAKRPVIVAGSQITAKPGQANDVAAALESLNVPVYLSGMARGLLGATNTLQSRHRRGEALKKADLVILLGVPMDFRLGYGNSFPRRTNLISVNMDSTDLYKNRTPTLPILAEPGSFVIKLAKQASKLASNFDMWKDWNATLKKADSERDEEIVKMSDEVLSDGFLNPMKVCQKLDEHLDKNSIMVADGGDFVATASYIVHPQGPLTWLDPGVFGTLGVGAGFALGAKLCRPDAEIWIIWGDGSSGYSIMEYDTFVRHNVPVISVIGNDGCWSQIYRDQVVFFESNAGCMLVRNEYDKVATSLGAVGLTIGPNDDMDKIFKEAKQAAKDGKPVVINALIGQTEFRKGSISV